MMVIDISTHFCSFVDFSLNSEVELDYWSTHVICFDYFQGNSTQVSA